MSSNKAMEVRMLDRLFKHNYVTDKRLRKLLPDAAPDGPEYLAHLKTCDPCAGVRILVIVANPANLLV